ncbi:MAG: putative signal transducing protein [Candidatus Poribacteria bacterium]
MPFCPKCRTEYVEGTVMCSDCQIELVDELPPEDDVEMVNWQVLQELPDEVVGYVLKGVLEEAGIKVYIRPLMIPGYERIRASWFKSNWGDLLVPEEDLEEARQIIDEYMSSLPDEEIEETEENDQ